MVEESSTENKKKRINRKDVVYLNGEYITEHWSTTRKKVLIRDGWKCQKCERYLGEDWDEPTIHHITPRYRGGGDNLENLITLCEDCHREIHRTDRPKNGCRAAHIFEG